MSVRTEKDGPVWAIINDRPEARNAGDPETTDALVESFLAFDAARLSCHGALLHKSGEGFTS
ncbi:MAG: hypothetical protein ABJO27_22755 [Pseudoruegeria sp.]